MSRFRLFAVAGCLALCCLAAPLFAWPWSARTCPGGVCQPAKPVPIARTETYEPGDYPIEDDRAEEFTAAEQSAFRPVHRPARLPFRAARRIVGFFRRR